MITIVLLAFLQSAATDSFGSWHFYCMPARAAATAVAALLLLAALALLSQTTRSFSSESSFTYSRSASLESADNQAIFSVSTDTNPNSGWRDPYGQDGVLTRAWGAEAVFGHEGHLNDNRAINEDTVPTYDNIVQGQFNHKMHLPFHAFVAQVSRFRLAPANAPKIPSSMKRLYRSAASGRKPAVTLKKGRSTAIPAKVLAAVQAQKKKGSFKQMRAEKRKLAAKAAAEARLYNRLWQEQGTDYSSSPRGNKVRCVLIYVQYMLMSLSLKRPSGLPEARLGCQRGRRKRFVFSSSLAHSNAFQRCALQAAPASASHSMIWRITRESSRRNRSNPILLSVDCGSCCCHLWDFIPVIFLQFLVQCLSQFLSPLLLRFPIQKQPCANPFAIEQRLPVTLLQFAAFIGHRR
jgi:hypothetical protein